MSGHADTVRSKLDKALDRPLTLDERRFAGDALDALERENKRLEEKLGVALTILNENDPDCDLVLRYFVLTTDEALAKEGL